jgi:hypothetical protein
MLRITSSLAAMALLATFVAGCAGMSTREQRVLSGGAIGAGAGLGVAAITGGSLLTGAVIGTAAGAVGGLIYDESNRRRR